MKFMPKRVILYFFLFISIYHTSHLKVESVELEFESIIKVGTKVFKDSKMLEYASLSLCDAYDTTNSYLSSFVDLRRLSSFVGLRRSVTNEVKAYSIKILPIATALIRRLQEFSENYDAISFDEFKEYFHECLANGAEENYMLGKYVQELHGAISIEFMILRSYNAEQVLRDLRMEVWLYEEKLMKLRREAGEKGDWIISLASIPFIELLTESEDINAQIIAIRKGGILAAAAARAIRSPLFRSIDKFDTAIFDITVFFLHLHQELKSFSDQHKSFESITDQNSSRREMHFRVIKRKATLLVSACRLFMGKILEFEKNLMAIPNDHNQNYVQEWLLKKQARVDEEKKTFVEWGKKWFGSNEDIIDLLGLP